MLTMFSISWYAFFLSESCFICSMYIENVNALVYDKVVCMQFIPHVFCMKYVPVMPCTVKLSLVNGYEIWLDFDKNKEVLSGVKVFLEDFGVVEGQTLVFLYVGGFDFHVQILGLDGSEIEYPSIHQQSQTSAPKLGEF